MCHIYDKITLVTMETKYIYTFRPIFQRGKNKKVNSTYSSLDLPLSFRVLHTTACKLMALLLFICIVIFATKEHCGLHENSYHDNQS